MKEKHFEVIVVGAGAAGLTAALFTARRGLSTLVVSKDLGGQASTTPDIENYPGFNIVPGWKLMDQFLDQVKAAGGKVKFEEVTLLHPTDDVLLVETKNGRYTCDTVILAFGKTPNNLGVPGEASLAGKSIFHALTKDQKPYRAKKVVVVGGGNSAAQFALTLATSAKQIHLLVRETALQCERALLNRIQKAKKIEVILNTNVLKFNGNPHLSSVTVETADQPREIEADLAYVAVGYSNQTNWLKGLVALDRIGQIIIQPDCSTSKSGIFAAGDVTTIPYKQVVISAGEGAKAAISAYTYVMKKQGRAAPTIDWGRRRI